MENLENNTQNELENPQKIIKNDHAILPAFLKQKIELKKIPASFYVGIISSLFIFLLAVFLIWYFRVPLTNYLISESVKDAQKIESIPLVDESGNITEKIIEKTSVFTQEGFVIDAVKKTNPAVVSIVISKEVPKYEAYIDPNQNTNPFGNLFPGFNFSVPQYRQNGTEKKEIGGGSGFFVTADGLIVTNKHVVNQTGVEYTVFTNDGKKHVATVVARDQVLDIALIKIPGNNYSYLSLGNSDSLQVGQSVIAIGNALAEFRNTVSVGVVSGLARSITAGDGTGKTEFLDKVIQTDAAINPGNSGGPLLNLRGEVVGVNVAVAQGGQNISFALPINSIKSVIDSVKATGKIVRPYIGVRFVAITEALKTKNNLQVDYGVLVQRGQSTEDIAVIPGSPADKAGIVENDIILEVDGVKLNDKNSLSSIIREKKIGTVVSLKILSKGTEKIVKLTLEAAKE